MMSVKITAEMFSFVNILMVLLIASSLSSGSQEERYLKNLKCPSTQNCTCHDYGEIEIQCPQFEPRVFVRVQPNNFVHFECENVTHNEYELIPEMKLEEAPLLQITKCPLLHGKPVTTYLKNIRMDKIRSFQFVSVGINRNNPIESQHFQGLGDIERFDLRGLENEFKELPSDLFKGMKKIKWVRIRVANIQLPDDLFAPLENLEFLELGHNKLQHLKPLFLRNQSKLQQLNLWGNALKSLNKDSFTGLRLVKELDLSGNGMETLESDVLFHLVSLLDINLSANNFKSLPEGLFANNRNLTTFRMIENRVPIESLPDDLLANLTELLAVSIKGDLKKVPEQIFENSMNIKTIRLEQNLIDELPEYLLNDQANLEQLYLSDNLISNIPDNFFAGTPKLKELKLSGNRLTAISGFSLRPLKRLTSLYLSYNQITTIDSEALIGLESVEFITLQNNQLKISSSPFQMLRHLSDLNLANNSLDKMLGDFTLESLKTINISHNQITSVFFQELQGISRSGLTVDLTYNSIEEVIFPESLSSEDLTATSQTTVILNDNPIQCDCKILFFVNYIQNRKITGNSLNVVTDGLQCEGPEDMKSKKVVDLNPNELLCPLDNGTEIKRCPDTCSCNVRLADKHLIMNCSSNVDFTQLPVASSSHLINTELIMEGGNLTSLPTEQSDGYKEITKLLLSNNNLTEIRIENLPSPLEVLHLDNNKLTKMNASVMNFINNSSMKLRLSGNPWICDCSTIQFLSFAQDNHKKIRDYKDLKCQNGKYFKDLKPSDICNDDNMYIIIISVIIAFMGLLLGGLAAVYYKYQKQIKMWLYSHNMCLWFVTEEELDKDKRYDAFVSYSHGDQDFVADYLVPELEHGTIPYKLCVHERDWLPGLQISTQISNSVNDAKRTIIVMSQNYLGSDWAKWEFQVAQSHAATEKRSRIIVILYGDIGDINKLEPEIRDYLKLNTYVKWGDKWFWEKLKYAMPHCKPSERAEKSKGLVKTVIKSSVDDKLELIKPVSVTPPQLATPPAEKVANSLITTLNAKNAANGAVPNGYHGHVNGAFIINTSSRQSDV